MLNNISATSASLLGDFLLPIAIIIAGVIGFLIWFYRDTIFSKKISKSAFDQEIEQHLDRIRHLARTHKYREASLLVWQAFSVAAYGFMGFQRGPNQSIRNFAMSLTQSGKVDPKAVMNVAELFERARYSDEEITTTQWNEGLGGLHRFLQTATALRSLMETNDEEEEVEVY